MLNVSHWKGVVRFGKRGKLNPRYIRPFKKCSSDEPLAILLDEIHIDEKLCFGEEPLEIMDRKVKQLKAIRFPSSKFDGTPGDVLSSRRNMMTSSERSICNSSQQPHHRQMPHLEPCRQGSVLGRERKGVSLDKSCVGEFFNNFSSDCWEELNKEFIELYETKFCVNGPAMIDLDSDEDLVMEYLIQEESRLKQEEEERCRLEEHKMMKGLFIKTLQEEVRRRDEKEKILKYEEEKETRAYELRSLETFCFKD
nr:hypothetical protein [Tanacetum cinerariifolium]